MIGAILSIAMLAVAALLWGSWRLFRSGADDRRKAWLMAVAALVLFGNVLILTL